MKKDKITLKKIVSIMENDNVTLQEISKKQGENGYNKNMH
jgi:hypothetical protein